MCDLGEPDEYPDVYVSEWHRARKQHKCCACDEKILPRERYHFLKHLFEGIWEDWKHCARCWAICQALWRASDGGSIELELNCGKVWRDPPEHVARLAFLSRAEAQELAGGSA
jgi:hypothetical protein